MGLAKPERLLMAKLNTQTANVLAKLYNPKTGRQFAIRSDGHVLVKTPLSSGWATRGIIAEGISPTDYIANRLAKGWIHYRPGMQPSYNALREMVSDGICSATDGCDSVEPDGHCEHGYASWLLALGMI
jgi:hypothetical protein